MLRVLLITGFKGGGYDRASLIRPAYHRRVLPTIATSEQNHPLMPVHDSLMYAFNPVRRFESHLTTPIGRTFASSKEMADPNASWMARPQSLMYYNMRGKAIFNKETQVGMTSAQVIGSSYLINNKPRPATAPEPRIIKSFPIGVVR